jgi:hypothetical protein
MGTEAVRFLVLWIAGWIHSRQLEVIDFCARRTACSASSSADDAYASPTTSGDAWPSKAGIVGRRRLGEFAGLVTPDTILRWYRELITRKYDGSARRRIGRPTVAADVEQLVVRMATENPTWGYTRLVGALGNLGHQVGRNTVERGAHGIERRERRVGRAPVTKPDRGDQRNRTHGHALSERDVLIRRDSLRRIARWGELPAGQERVGLSTIASPRESDGIPRSLCQNVGTCVYVTTYRVSCPR